MRTGMAALVLLALAGHPPGAHAAMVKCKMADGSVSFRDGPCPDAVVGQQMKSDFPPARFKGGAGAYASTLASMLIFRGKVLSARAAEAGTITKYHLACLNSLMAGGNPLLPDYRGSVEKMLAKELDSQQMKDIGKFYESRTGMKSLALGMEGVYDALGEKFYAERQPLTPLEQRDVDWFKDHADPLMVLTPQLVARLAERPEVAKLTSDANKKCRQQ